MPLDVDQYAIRRTYRNRAVIGISEPKRNTHGNLVGTEFKPMQTLGYKPATITQIDQQFYSEVINRVDMKIEIPPSKIIKQRQQSLTVKMDGQLYNIKEIDESNYRRWFLYLSKITKKGVVNDGE